MHMQQFNGPSGGMYPGGPMLNPGMGGIGGMVGMGTMGMDYGRNESLAEKRAAAQSAFEVREEV